MAECLSFYKCEICGTIVQVFHKGDGELVCCGKPMHYIQAHKPEEELQEKHVPVFTQDKVLVGSIPHPMMPEHHIEFIETISEDKKELHVKFLDVCDNPEMELKNINAKIAYEYCNLHGLWENIKE